MARRFERRLAGRRRQVWRTWGWTALLLWMTSPLESFLSGVDPAAPALAAGTPLYRYARDVTLLLPALALLGRGEAAWRLARSAWPLLLFLAYAAASVAWSDDRGTSWQALINAAPLVASGAALPLVLRPGRAAQALLQALALAAIGSLAAALLIPRFAVAGPHDLLGASTPGDWRGLYVHKNMLGHTAALAVAALATRGGRLVRPRALRWAGLVCGVICIALARSASALALAVALPVIALLMRPRGLARAALAGVLVAAAASAFAARALILAAGLAALGRDASLSGRTAIWRMAGELAQRRALFGWGLDDSVSPAVAARLVALFGVNHVHNAELDVFLNLGAVGVTLWALAIAGALACAARARGQGAARDVLALLVAGWLLSGLTEDMGVRIAGPVAMIGGGALWSLYGLEAQRRAFRRPAWRFPSAWAAPLRPPRLRDAP